MSLSRARNLLLVCLFLSFGCRAMERTVLTLTLTDNGFMPASLTVNAGQKLIIRMSNQSNRVSELESYDMKFEKIASPGSTISVFAGPLKPGKYKFFDDYSTKGFSGWLTVKEN